MEYDPISKIEYEGYTLEVHDPYGFIFIRGYTGARPKELEGSFTTIRDAQKAVDSYLARKAMETKDIGTIAKEYHEKLLKAPKEKVKVI